MTTMTQRMEGSNGTNLKHENESKSSEPKNKGAMDDVNSPDFPPLKFVRLNVVMYTLLHLTAAMGLYLLLSGNVRWQTVIWAFLVYCFGMIGITGGAHRLWSHRAYKAKFPLRILLVIMQATAFQNSAYEWARDHRVHHKYSETHADPHNAKRGFWFAHIGWLMTRKHPLVKEKGKQIDLSDLHADKVLMFQKKYYYPMMTTCCFVIPTIVPWLFWKEPLVTSWLFAGQFRFVLSLHFTWLVNSAAHLWGERIYDKSINPAENASVSVLALGEGWHNYHHTFPQDYKAAELGNYRANLTTAFIEFFAWLGWAYDLKTMSKDVIQDRILRTGNEKHPRYKLAEKCGEKSEENSTKSF